jgi:hypothetical protein
MADRNTKKGCNEELYVKETWSMDRTIGKSQNRDYDGERLMISLLEIVKSINEVDDDAGKHEDGDTWTTASGKYAGKYKGEADYFDDKEDASDYAKHGPSGMPDDDGDDSEKDSGGKLSDTDFDRDGNEDDNDKSDDVEISDANSGPIDTDDIMDMLKNDSEVVDKMGDDVYWDGMDLVSSKYDDDTIASIPDDASMTLADLKKQIMDYEEEQDESIKVIDGKKYKAIKESKKHILKENYDRTYRSLK